MILSKGQGRPSEKGTLREAREDPCGYLEGSGFQWVIWPLRGIWPISGDIFLITDVPSVLVGGCLET